MKAFRSFFAAFLCLACAAGFSTRAQAPAASQSDGTDALLRNFLDPPNEARPRVWWHWMNGNISTEGIKLDLEWMHRRGRGRRDHLRRRHQYAAGGSASADLYDAGVEAGIQYRRDHCARPGYGSGHRQLAGMERNRRTVGSRVAGHEEDGVDAQRALKAASRSRGKLPHPPQVDGTFQNFQVPGRRAPDGTVTTPPEFYADAAVIAYKIPDGDKTQAGTRIRR